MHQVFMSLSVLWTITTFAAATMAGEEQAKAAADDPCRIEVLNNLVSELMDAGKRGLLGQPEIAFVNPRKGWCFFAVAGDAALTLDSENRPLAVAKGSATVEAMRYLPAGRHTLKLTGRAAEAGGSGNPRAGVQLLPGAVRQIAAFGAPSWQWLQKTVLANCNTIEGSDHCAKEMAEWRGQGKQWVIWSGVPGRNGVPMEDGYAYWRKSPGYSHPLMSGLQIDEFLSGVSSPTVQKNALDGVARLAADPAFRGRQWIPFVSSMANSPHSGMRPVKAVCAGGLAVLDRVLPARAVDRGRRAARYLAKAPGERGPQL